jgi:putative Holliday junction resolvase
MGGRWFGLDVGEKTLGLAVSDPLKITVRPLTTLRRGSIDEDFRHLARLINTHDVTRLVVGLPRHMDGSDSDVRTHIQPLFDLLQKRSDIPTCWQDERLSTREADDLMAAHKIPMADRPTRRDEFAAVLILQWYIEEHGEDR